jgi:L,D-peptidoglycan transpeptidase YkuD (ErfK/YbiS/YcfS/YnhG family)
VKWIALILLVCTGVGINAAELKLVIPELAECRQLILVTTKDWNSSPAQLRCFERSADLNWKEALSATPAIAGRNGWAWGIGLHGTSPAGGLKKQEGDGRAPAGVFALNEVFGYAAASEAKINQFPYRQLTAKTEGIDDPRSRFYNRLVETSPATVKDWKTSETMLLPGGLYRWGVFVEHNWKQRSPAGSCIFLHIWTGPKVGTAGCTAMPAPRMEAIARWLDRRSHPLLVQLPEAEYQRLKDPWALP